VNTYTKAFKPSQAPRTWRSQSSTPWLFPVAVKLGLMGALIFLAVNYRISYDEKAESLNREASRIKMKIHRLNLEVANLKIRKESLSSWANIGSKIRNYNLALRPAEPEQIREIALIPSGPEAAFVHSGRQAAEPKRLQLSSK
jgi:hypothetical protein